MVFATLEDGLWETELENCYAAELIIPIGGWREADDPEEDKLLKEAGELMRKSLLVRSVLSLEVDLTVSF